MSARFTIEGYLARIQEFKRGCILTIGEKKPNKLAKPVYHRVAVWGKQALKIGPHLKPGTKFSFSGPITYAKRNDTTYTNFTVEHWGIITDPTRPIPRKPPAEDLDDDWYVPEPANYGTHEHRLAEGFTAPPERKPAWQEFI